MSAAYIICALWEGCVLHLLEAAGTNVCCFVLHYYVCDRTTEVCWSVYRTDHIDIKAFVPSCL